MALGDGQTDISTQVLLGAALGSHWFARLDGGFVWRLFGPGQQASGTLKVGARVHPALLLIASGDALHSFTQGAVVGTSKTTDVPETPADQFQVEYIIPVDYRLDRSLLRAGVGAIITNSAVDIDINYSYVLWGINIAQLHAFSVGTTFRW